MTALVVVLIRTHFDFLKGMQLSSTFDIFTSVEVTVA